jgi:hypothetical protein
MKKPAGSQTTLRETIHPAFNAVPGDVLQTSTGRRYEVLETNGRIAKVRVMRLNEPIPAGGRLGTWTWGLRRKAKAKRT